MALEKIPADIRGSGGVARMSDPGMIEEIMAAVSIPVMAKCRIGHFVEAQILEELGVDYVDESEVLTIADEDNHIDKTKFNVRQLGMTRRSRHLSDDCVCVYVCVCGAGAFCVWVPQPW